MAGLAEPPAGGPEKRLLIRSANMLACLGARIPKKRSPIAVINYERVEMRIRMRQNSEHDRSSFPLNPDTYISKIVVNSQDRLVLGSHLLED